MWVNPKYRDQVEAQRQAPAETGRRLATFPRNEGTEELRLTIDEYQGRPYLSLRLWRRGDDGRWFPTRKGVSVRMGEVDGLIEALGAVAAGPPQDRRGATGGRPDPRSAERGPRRTSGPTEGTDSGRSSPGTTHRSTQAPERGTEFETRQQ